MGGLTRTAGWAAAPTIMENMMIDLKAVFDRHGDDYIEFDRVENKLHTRPDLCAFLLLDKLLPGGVTAIVSAVAHDEIFLTINLDFLA